MVPVFGGRGTASASKAFSVCAAYLILPGNVPPRRLARSGEFGRREFGSRRCLLSPRERTCGATSDVRFGPEADTAGLFNHLVCAGEQRWRHCDAERLSGNQVDHYFELGRLFDRQFGRLCPAQNLVDVISGAPGKIGEAWSIGDQTRRLNAFPRGLPRRQARSQRQGVDAVPVAEREQVLTDIKCVRISLEGIDGERDIRYAPDFQGNYVEPEDPGRC